MTVFIRRFITQCFTLVIVSMLSAINVQSARLPETNGTVVSTQAAAVGPVASFYVEETHYDVEKLKFYIDSTLKRLAIPCYKATTPDNVFFIYTIWTSEAAADSFRAGFEEGFSNACIELKVRRYGFGNSRFKPKNTLEEAHALCLEYVERTRSTNYYRVESQASHEEPCCFSSLLIENE